ncbi:MAG: serine hydrolase [Kiloniellales bacterium]|nr:serine hydrolase [Kiloniellales bacterium]
MAALTCFLALAAAMLTAAPAQAKYASVVIDAETGEVLHAKNSNTRNYPASLVKMMTLYMVFDALEKRKLKLNQGLRVSRRAAGMPPSKLGLRRGQTIRVKEAILALVTKSANDVAVVVAEAIGGTESQFARKMTKKARKLGMKRTTFRNASGLPNRRQLSTARDMATLARALIRDFPQYYHFFATQKFKYRGRTYRNHNKLLRTYSGADGIKTGYIRASGYNLVASSVRNGRRVIAVVFGGKTSRSRNRHTATLLDRGFKRLTMIARNYPPPPRRKPTAIAAARQPRGAEIAVNQAAQPASPATVAPPKVQQQRHGGTSLETEAVATFNAPATGKAAGLDTQAILAELNANQPGAPSSSREPAKQGTLTAEDLAAQPLIGSDQAAGTLVTDAAVPPPAAVESVPLVDTLARRSQSAVAAAEAPAPATEVAAAPPPPAPPKPATAAAAKAGTSLEFQVVEPRRKPGPYGVQVGAFYRYRPAQKAAQKAFKKAPKLLAEAEVSVTHVRGARGKLYRSRLVGLSKRNARQACRKLRSLKIDCMVVRVGRSTKVAGTASRTSLAAN